MNVSRRTLLASLGLTLSAASAEAATRKKTAKTPKTAKTAKAPKRRTAKHAPTQS